MRDHMDMAGRLTILVHDRAGQLVLDQRQHNRIVTSGRRLVAEMFGGTTGTPRTPISSIAVGTGNTAPADIDTALVARRGDPKAITKVEYSNFTDTQGVARVRVQVTAQFDFGEANDPSTPLREAGLLNKDGVLYSRVVFKDVTKTDTFQLTLLWDIIF
ncbi:hypothetical protein [Actinopolymorpha pittospori]|uniref:Uncharacterized protein n=1 Tax=Actinopolymorpha pittospori TaxID=648752 RepID=A0A927N355_9ACTN|nr:hypothetical protein [Actinopolymorpha pittospori]MBE1610103.1 hypothetical protein [Actinopolymorpha pittospori]